MIHVTHTLKTRFDIQHGGLGSSWVNEKGCGLDIHMGLKKVSRHPAPRSFDALICGVVQVTVSPAITVNGSSSCWSFPAIDNRMVGYAMAWAYP